jgi:hypothetical protein
MTNTEILTSAGWTKLPRTIGECGEAIVTRGKLFGLACEKRAVWTKDGGPAVCQQHALTTQKLGTRVLHIGKTVEYRGRDGVTRQEKVAHVEILRYPAGSTGLILEGGGILPYPFQADGRFI